MRRRRAGPGERSSPASIRARDDPAPAEALSRLRSPRHGRGARPGRADAGPRVPPVASYTIEAQVNADHGITGRETVRFTNRTKLLVRGSPAPPLPERVEERPLDVAHRAGARRRKERPRGAREGGEPVGLFRDPPHRPRGRHRPDAVAAVPLARRRQPRRPDARLGRAAAAGRARRDARLSRGLGGRSFRAPWRARAGRTTTFSAPSGSRSWASRPTPAGTRTSSTPRRSSSPTSATTT